MTSIDWSKGPADAEYARRHCDGLDFYKRTDEGTWVYWDSRGQWSRAYGTREADCIARPAWNGEGLPPVGFVCEVNLGGPDWVEVQSLAHFRNSAAMVAAFIPTADGEKRVDQAIADCFRPIRTAEQIAADERNRGIDTLCEFIRGTAGGNDFHRPFWERAYDRGLRAPE